MSNLPAHKIKLGLTTATIWKNDGSYSVDITRSYKNSDGEWKNTSGFFHSDLLNIAKCAERAEIWISRQLGSGPIDFRLGACFTVRKLSGEHV